MKRNRIFTKIFIKFNLQEKHEKYKKSQKVILKQKMP